MSGRPAAALRVLVAAALGTGAGAACTGVATSIGGKPGAEARLRDGMARVRVAGIGPIVDEALAARGVRIDVMPEKAFVMRRLVDALAAALGPRG